MAAVNASDVASFEATIQQCRGGTIVAVDGKKCNPSLRGWCLYEWDKTEANYGIEGLFMTGMTPEDRKRVVEGIDVANAECFNASDLAMIHGNIIASHGSLEKFDESLVDMQEAVDSIGMSTRGAGAAGGAWVCTRSVTSTAESAAGAETVGGGAGGGGPSGRCAHLRGCGATVKGLPIFKSVVSRKTSSEAMASGSTNASFAMAHMDSALVGMPTTFAFR